LEEDTKPDLQVTGTYCGLCQLQAATRNGDLIGINQPKCGGQLIPFPYKNCVYKLGCWCCL